MVSEIETTPFRSDRQHKYKLENLLIGPFAAERTYSQKWLQSLSLSPFFIQFQIPQFLSFFVFKHSRVSCNLLKFAKKVPFASLSLQFSILDDGLICNFRLVKQFVSKLLTFYNLPTFLRNVLFFLPGIFFLFYIFYRIATWVFDFLYVYVKPMKMDDVG